MAEGRTPWSWTLNGLVTNVQVTKRFTLRRGDYLIEVDYLVENGSDAAGRPICSAKSNAISSHRRPQTHRAWVCSPSSGAALTQPDERFTKFYFDDMAEEPFKAQLPGGWIAMIQHYFLSAWIPNAEQSSYLQRPGNPQRFNIAGFTSPPLALDPGSIRQVPARVSMLDPKDQYRLQEISPYLELSVDYGWLVVDSPALFWLLTKIHALVGNWGVAIIC